MTMAAPIDSFFGDYFFLSNFYPSVVRVPVCPTEVRDAPTVEHGFQAMKSMDREVRIWILSADRPGEAKRRGRSVVVRHNWERIKEQIMDNLLRQKFRHHDLRERLLATGDAELIEGNTWGDTYWGVYRGHGGNRLGHLLMQIRADFREPGLL